MFTHNYVFFSQSSSYPLLRDLKLLRLPDILETEVVKYFVKFYRNVLPELVRSQFNLADEVHTNDILKYSLIYIPEMSTT